VVKQRTLWLSERQRPPGNMYILRELLWLGTLRWRPARPLERHAFCTAFGGLHFGKECVLMPGHVEFIGGPLDGYRYGVSSASALPATVGFPVHRGVFDALEGRRAAERAPVTSLAVYRLVQTACACHYQFVGAMLPQALAQGSKIEG
jgi:hypothetical protein